MDKKPKRHIDHYLNRELQSIKGEKWKPVKDFEEFYELSNFGRVKAYPRFREVLIPKRGAICYWTKEMIMKPIVRKEKNNYTKDYSCNLSITLYKDKRYHVFMIGRLVYQHFCPCQKPLSKDMLILHLDGNGLNNHIDNLYPATYSDMHTKTFKNKRRESIFTDFDEKMRIKYTTKAIKSNLQPVSQYNLAGSKIGYFKSLKAASKKLGIDDGVISNALNGRYLTAGGFAWKKGDGVQYINVKKIIALKKRRSQHLCKPVEQCSLQGKKLASFQSITLAAKKVGGSVRQLSDALNGRSKTSYGYVWKFEK